MKNNSLDMTVGSPMELLLRFTLPTLAGNLLHQAYSITDSIIVGRYLGQTALAAVGCTMPIVMLLAALMVGINTGVGIIISQYFGRRDHGRIRRAFLNSLYLGLAVSAAMAVLGSVLAEPILRWMGTPEQPLRDAAAYLRINFMTTVCPMFYYLFSCAFRGLGDSQTALSCLIVSVLANISLDILFVAVFRWGVAGSAWATALAQALSAVFSAVLLYRRYPVMRIQKGDAALNPGLLADITKLALPIAVQSSFNNVGNLVAQSAVNTFGEAAMAAYTAASRVGTLSLMPVETVASSLAIYAGQNHGAGKPGRIQDGVRASLYIVLAVSSLLGVGLFLGGRPLTKLFLTQPSEEIYVVVERFLLITAVPGLLAGAMHIYQQVLRGVGLPNPALAGGLMQLAVKIALVAAGTWLLHDLTMVWLGWPASFVAGALVPYVYYRRRFSSGPQKKRRPREKR